MRPIKLVAGGLFTIVPMLGMLLMLAKGSATIAGENVLQGLTPITNEVLKAPAPKDWLMRRGNYSCWGYSALDQIDTGNVSHLKLAWAWNMSPGYQEEAPLVHDGVLFLGNPHNVVQALNGRTGDLLWEYRRQLPKVEGGYHNDLFDRSRGTIALYDDKVILTPLMLMSWLLARGPERSNGTPRSPIIPKASRSQAARSLPKAK